MPYIGFKYFIIVGQDLEVWTKKYDLEAFSCPCNRCHKELAVNIPFIGEGKRRGLISKVCECGNDEVPFSYIDLNSGPGSLNSLKK